MLCYRGRRDREPVHRVLEQNLTSSLRSEADMDDQLLSILLGKTCGRVTSLPFVNTVSRYSCLLVHTLLDAELKSAHVV